MKLRISRIAAGTAVLFLSATTSVLAVPVQWTVDYSNSRANVSVTGSFVYDADLNAYSDVDLAVASYLKLSDGTTPVNATLNVLWSGAVNDKFAQFRSAAEPASVDYVFMNFSSLTGLTNAGGVISNSASLVFSFDVFVCLNSDCTSQRNSGVAVETSESTLTGRLLDAEVPLPATLPLLALGLGGLGALARRKRG